MDLDQITKGYHQIKENLFHNPAITFYMNNYKIKGLSLSRFESLNSLCRLIETSHNKNVFHGRFFQREVKIDYEDRKLIVLGWTTISILIGRKPKFIFTPFTFILASMLFWRELYTTIPKSE